MCTYRCFIRSARNFREFARARKITQARGLSYERAHAACRAYNAARNAAQVRRGTCMEFESEG